MEYIADFHFLRPYWLLLLPPLVILSLWLRYKTNTVTGLESWISAHLLSHIRVDPKQARSYWKYYGLCVIWTISLLALAGPTWQQIPHHLHETENATIILLDLSPSMLAEDTKPSRIVRARLKIQDLLSQQKEGLTALIVYAGEAHIVTPLTDDQQTIINLLPTLKPGLLPIPGSNIEMAVDMGRQLVVDSGINSASLVIVSDGISPSAFTTIEQLMNKPLTLFMLGIGTTQGAPIPVKEGFLKDPQGNIINAVRNDQDFQTLANRTQGYYLPLQTDDSDIQFIMNTQSSLLDAQQSRKIERNIDQWYELGPTWLLFILPIALLAFRRGYLLFMFIIVPIIGTPQTSYAFSLNDLWKNKNQQAEQAFEKQHYEKATQLFNNTRWKGAAAYRNKDYQTAIDAFSQGDTATDFYNKGNALAQIGQFDQAIEAYNEALQRQPDFDDAKKNQQLVQELKKQQQNSEDKQENNDDSKESSQDSSQRNNDSEGNEKKDPSQNSEDQQKNQDNKQQNSTAENEPNKESGKESEEKPEKEPDNNGPENNEQDSSLAHLSEEEKQALEQWIRKIPDDPSGLLRRKFDYEFRKRQQSYQKGEWKLPENNAHQRY